jgi:PPK2 family polyphosphate:nucleotide phosphotransferase
MERYRIKPGTKVQLDRIDPDDTSAFSGSKKKAEAEVDRLNERLEKLQELLYAENKHRVLIVLQAMDAGGKDGTIRKVFEGVNPQGVSVVSFKVPTAEDLAHDFLWRVHLHVPGNGRMTIFNRSHYEDVLVVRVHGLVEPRVWKGRYEQIKNFERLLADTGTTILKFYLHIDSDEQKRRLQARLDTPEKRWKFRLADLDERKLWPDYMRAYEDAIQKTSTEWAPWYVVPANKKWYRDLVVSRVLVQSLEDLHMKYPEPVENLDGIIVE